MGWRADRREEGLVLVASSSSPDRALGSVELESP